MIHGVEAVGRRLTITIPGNDGPLHVVDERWESPELKMVIYARSADPRTGIVEYRLSNIRRADPPSDLFEIPPDYTITRDLSLTWITLEYADSHLRKSGLSRTLPR